MTGSGGSSRVIKKVWLHAHENLPSVELDFHGRVISSRPKDPPFRYLVSYEQYGELYCESVVANDELDAILKFNRER